jgi:acyl carrier protein
MLHTYVGESDDAVRELVRGPMKSYLASSVSLIKHFAWTFPAFKRPAGGKMADIDLTTLTEAETDAILEHAFERYFETSGMMGTPETCMRMVERAKAAGIDEIGCMIDFGVHKDAALEGLKLLNVVREQANQRPASADAAPIDTTSATVPAARDHSLAAQIARHHVTHMQCTPSMARMMLHDDETRRALGSIRHMMVGGEAFPPSLARELRGVVGGTITNMYGPTETTIWSSTEPMNGDPTTVLIGRPIANTQLYIADQHLQPVPVGVPGELLIGGDGVVRGYLNRPDLTHERFIPDPFMGRSGARLYRTGDLARYRDDGRVEFLGRFDHQVKVRGYRIELGEIEARLAEHPLVKECVVIAREDVPGDVRLVAYLRSAGDVPEVEALRTFLAATLPEFMVPAAFAVVDAFPLTPNAKIDRKALPSPEDVAPQRRTQFRAPEGSLEQSIATVWKDVLNLESVGTDDNFFDLGGHSLLVVQVHRTLRDALERPIALTDLYRFSTIRSLAEHLGSDRGAAAAVEQSQARAHMRQESMQRRLRRSGRT